MDTSPIRTVLCMKAFVDAGGACACCHKPPEHKGDCGTGGPIGALRWMLNSLNTEDPLRERVEFAWLRMNVQTCTIEPHVGHEVYPLDVVDAVSLPFVCLTCDERVGYRLQKDLDLSLLEVKSVEGECPACGGVVYHWDHLRPELCFFCTPENAFD